MSIADNSSLFIMEIGLLYPSLPVPELEYKFHPKRKWRFDIAWPKEKVAVEIEGGIWIGGRHITGSGYEKDCEKYNAALLLGWKVLRYTTSMLKNNTTNRYDEVAELLSL